MDQSDFTDAPFHLDLELFQFLLRQRVEIEISGTFGFPKQGCWVDRADDGLGWR